MTTNSLSPLTAALLITGSALTAFGADRPAPERIPADQLQVRLAPRETMNRYTKVVMLDGSVHTGRRSRFTKHTVAVSSDRGWNEVSTDQVATIEIWPDRQNRAHIRRAARASAKVVNAPCAAMEGPYRPVSVCAPLKIASGAAWLGTALATVAPVVFIHDLKALASQPDVYEVVH